MNPTEPERTPTWRLRRRDLLEVGAVGVAFVALGACGSAPGPASSSGSGRLATRTDPNGSGQKNIRVTNDRYGVHVGPSVAINPRDPRQLLAICGVAAGADPSFIGTYISTDAGATWRSGGLPPQPQAGPAGDDLTVAYDATGRGYVCATRAGHTSRPNPADPNADRAVYVWHTDDGGRSFSAPVTLLQDEYGDHPWLATGKGSSGNEVYVAWGAGSATAPALGFTRSADRGASFEEPRTILPTATSPSLVSAGPEVASGPDGLIVAVSDWTVDQTPSGDLVGHVVAVTSTDGGQTFSDPSRVGSEAAVISLPDNVLPNSMPAVVVSPDGHAIHAAFTTHAAGAAHSDIVVTTSTDRGQSWSRPAAATPHDDRIYFQPRLAVADSGRIALSVFALKDGRVTQVLMTSPEAVRFGLPVDVSSTPFDPRNAMTSGGKHGAWWIGDCQGVAAGADDFHLVWNDNRTGKLELFSATVR